MEIMAKSIFQMETDSENLDYLIVVIVKHDYLNLPMPVVFDWI